MPQNQQTRAVRVTVVDSRHTWKELKGHEGTQMESSQWGAGVAQWLERLTRNQNVPGWSLLGAAGEFSSPGSAFCSDSYFGIPLASVLPLSHVKDPSHFVGIFLKSAL